MADIIKTSGTIKVTIPSEQYEKLLEDALREVRVFLTKDQSLEAKALLTKLEMFDLEPQVIRFPSERTD